MPNARDPARWGTIARWCEKANDPSSPSPRPRRRRPALGRIRGSRAVILSPGVLRPLGGLADQPLDITELVPLTWARHGPAGGEGGPTRMGPALVAAAWGRKSPPLHPIYRIVSSAKRKTRPPTRPVTALRVCVRVSNWSEPKRRQLVPPDADRTRSARSRDGTEGPGRGGRSSPCGARMTDRAGSTGARMVCRTRRHAFAIPRGPWAGVSEPAPVVTGAWGTPARRSGAGLTSRRVNGTQKEGT
jgi:hypothetical protein